MLHSIEYFLRIFLAVYLYFRHTPIMFPKKSGKEKRKTTTVTLGVKKESWQNLRMEFVFMNLHQSMACHNRQYQRF